MKSKVHKIVLFNFAATHFDVRYTLIYTTHCMVGPHSTLEGQQKKGPAFLKKTMKKVNFPNSPRSGRRVSSSAFLSRRPFGYYLPIGSYGTILGTKLSR